MGPDHVTRGWGQVTAALQPGCKKAEVVGSQTRVLLFPSSAEILQANDLLTQGVLLYKQVMEGRVNTGSKTPRPVGNVPVSRGMCRACPRPLPVGSLLILEKNGSLERLGHGVEMRECALLPFLRAGLVSQPLSGAAS